MSYVVPGRIRLRGLGKSYREGGTEHVVLDGVDADIRPGELVVVLGRSGSGKSTLLNLIGGIDEPDRGEVVIGDTVVSRLDERRRTLFRREHVGFVFQFFNLIPTLTVEENLLLPLELKGQLDAAARDSVLDLLEQVGLRDRRGAFPDRLSGGEQQRVAIARALAARPEVVLADEPTGNLDHETGERVLELLEGLVRGRGGTMVMATHSREIGSGADRVLSIRDGRLEEIAAGRAPGA
ncbi:MAG: ABC transporter ATP-binding protein [Acidobacteriota bacterium]